MAHFYGTLQGNRGRATRCGSRASGMKATCASWAGAVECYAYPGADGRDWVMVQLAPWHGAGEYRVLYSGPISGEVMPARDADGEPVLFVAEGGE